MSTDVRERLRAAAGTPTEGPDVTAALRRGTHLRRRRRAAVGGGTLAAVALVVGLGIAVVDPVEPGVVTPTTDDRRQDEPTLEILEQPPTGLDSYVTGTPGQPGVGLERPEHRLRDPGSGPDGADRQDIAADRARLAAEHDGLAIHLVPPAGDAVDVTGDVVEQPWTYVYAVAPGWRFWGSVPIPAPGRAAWAGSFPYGVGDDHRLVGIVVVGDGLDTGHTSSGTVEVQDNVVVLEEFGYDSTVTFTGPAGEHTLRTPRAP